MEYEITTLRAQTDIQWQAGSREVRLTCSPSHTAATVRVGVDYPRTKHVRLCHTHGFQISTALPALTSLTHALKVLQEYTATGHQA